MTNNLDPEFKATLTEIKNRDLKDNRTKFFRAVLTGKATYQPFFDITEAYPNDNLANQLVLFKTVINWHNMSEYVLVVYSPLTDMVGFFREADHNVLRYSETLDKELPDRLQEYFSERIKNVKL